MGQLAVERLREFLRELKPGARALLIAELERGLLNGTNAAGSELILAELRRGVREGADEAPRVDDHVRLFFRPVEPFLVDDVLDHKHLGRIARPMLGAIWRWLSDTVMRAEAAAYGIAIREALLASDTGKCGQVVQAFQDAAIGRIEAELDAIKDDDRKQRRLCMILGAPRAMQDVAAVVAVMKARDDLAQLDAELPDHINALSDLSLKNVKAQLDQTATRNPELLLYALLLVMNRLAASWQLIRLATRAAKSDKGARVVATPYGVAVTMALAEVERMVRQLTADIRSGRGIAVSAMLKDVHDALRGLRAELDLEIDSNWGRQLTAMRADISKLLSAEIESTPGRARKLLKARAASEIRPNSTIDANEVDKVEQLIGLSVACRNYASELAVNEITKRTYSDLQEFLDSAPRLLLEALRTAGEAERPFCRSQVEAAVRFCGKAFGQEYATLLSKAAEVAAQGPERKAAKG